MAGNDVIARLDRLEAELEQMQRELEAVRLLAQPAGAPPSPEPLAVAHVEPSPLAEAWRKLERGWVSAALDLAFEAARAARVARDLAALQEIAAFADAALAHTSGRQHDRVRQLAARVSWVREELGPPGPPRSPAATSQPSPTPARAPTPAPRAPGEPRPVPVLERLAAWLQAELTGARLFAVAGGVVTLLGVIFFFVLAANRGWVGPAERVALGAAASLGVLLGGVVLRLRYGRVNAALGAVGAGVAGAYATLAAATILYGYLPPAGALVVAAGIAAAGATIAIAWSSQLLAGLALVGAAAAPAAVALDDGIEWAGTAFALVVLATAIAVASPRRWLWLGATVAGVAGGQVLWLAAAAPLDDTGAVATAAAAAAVLLAAAVAWQAYGEEGLHGATASFALAAGGMALLGPVSLLSSDRSAGLLLVALAVAFAAVALLAGRFRFADLAWTVGAEALLLGGVAAAYLVTGRSLTVVWAIEAVVLAGLAWKLQTPRFAAASLTYLAAGVVHAFAVEILPDWPESVFDVPRTAAAGLFVLAGASVAAGLLLPSTRADAPGQGLLASLEPVWDALLRARVGLRALLSTGAAVLAAFATAAVLSGRSLTVLWAALAVAAGAAAYALGERRLQPFALAAFAFAVAHALAVEVPPRTLAVEGADTSGGGVIEAVGDPLASVPSLLALAVAAAALGALACFRDRGIAWLGTPVGPELRLSVLRNSERGLRAALAFVACAAVTWAVGLVAIDRSYESGQVVASGLWAALGTGVVFLAVRARSSGWQIVGGGLVVLALVKSASFDWSELGDGPAAASLSIVAAALLCSGFQVRNGNPTEPQPVEVISVVSGLVAGTAAIVALERVLGTESRALGLASLAVVGALAACGLPAYLGWRSGRSLPWERPTANGYWALALGALLFAESAFVLREAPATLALWAATAALLAVSWQPLAEDRVWAAAAGLTAVCAAGTLGLVTEPEQLVQASEHPASGLWSLAVVVLAAWAVALRLPEAARPWGAWVLGSAAGLTLYGASLGVLEIVERVSSASVTTDFQRAHTVLSALWGAGALALYVVGLARDRSGLRIVGLTLFGLALAKLFLYDLSTLSSITRAFSFLALGAILLAAGFFAERLVRPDAGGTGGRPTGRPVA